VYLPDHAAPVFYVGSRGHHADIGGTSPGSMPPFSTSIEEEGVQIQNFKLVEGGVLREAAMVALLSAGAHPSRNPAQNMADLRAQIAARMTRQGTPCSADDVLILHGGQQGLDLVAKLFLNPGDVVITENPTFLGALIAFNPYEPNYVAIDMDDDGMDMNQLEQALLTTPNAKLIYTVPDFHNPTGVTMSLARRHELIGLANRFNLIILEDTPYREIRFAGESLPTLKSLDTEDRVIYLGTFSKILAPVTS
jgi:DNA-binding transcriptional MocR family regulator